MEIQNTDDIMVEPNGSTGEMTQPSGVQDTMKEPGHDININCGLVPQTILEGAGDGLTGMQELSCWKRKLFPSLINLQDIWVKDFIYKACITLKSEAEPWKEIIKTICVKSDNLEHTEGIIYEILRTSEIIGRESVQDLEKRLERTALLSVIIYSNELFRDLSNISEGDEDETMDRLFGKMMALFHRSAMAFWVGNILQIVIDFDNEVKKFRQSLIREILCVFDGELGLYDSEMILFFNTEMKSNIDDLANKTLSEFERQVDKFDEEFEKNALKVIDVELNALSGRDYLADDNTASVKISIDIQSAIEQSKPLKDEDVVGSSGEAFLPLTSRSSKSKRRNGLEKIVHGIRNMFIHR